MLVVPSCWFPNDSVVGDTVATGAIPVPLSDTVCAATGDAKLIVSVAVTWPIAVGLNVTLNMQVLLAAIFLTQFIPTEKGDEAGVRVTLVTVTAVVVLVFLIVTV